MLRTMNQTTATPTCNAAEIEAESNYRANLEALARAQPHLALTLGVADMEAEWIFARDGSLTAMQPGDRWWGDCSLPRRAGQFMFKTMEIHGVVACFLNPIHAAHLRVTLGMMEPQQAIIAIVGDPSALWLMLHCDDFTAEFRSHRLWFVTGEKWESDLKQLFADNPGLPTASQFIRAISTDNAPADALIAPAQKIFAEEQDRRGALARSAFANWLLRDKREGNICVIAPSRFRLWNDAPFIVAQVARQAAPILEFDPDDPASASPLALAQRARECDAIVAANLSRADLPDIVPEDMPWTTWVTLGRIPRREDCRKHDRLLLAEPQWLDEARARGWKDDESELAGWPGLALPQDRNEGFVALIADTRRLRAPRHISEYSSQLLLWELIQRELTADPFLINNVVARASNPCSRESSREESAGRSMTSTGWKPVPQAGDQYLDSRIAQLRVAEESLNRAFFLEHLIVPAYQQGLARLLIEHGVPVRLFGEGWEKIPQFATHFGGAVETRERFAEILGRCAAVVHAWPSERAHPIDAIEKPILRPFGRTMNEFLVQPICPSPARDLARLCARSLLPAPR